MNKRTDNVGSLSRNRKKEKPTHPDHRGSCTVAGVEYWISAYINESRDEGGGKYFKLYFNPKNSDPVPAPDQPNSNDTDNRPEIPF